MQKLKRMGRMVMWDLSEILHRSAATERSQEYHMSKTERLHIFW
jgi:hypothetical protein